RNPAGGEGPPFSRGDGVARGVRPGRAAQEVRNVEDDERQTHENQAPFQPALVPTHFVEHGHWCTFTQPSGGSTFGLIVHVPRLPDAPRRQGRVESPDRRYLP